LPGGRAFTRIHASRRHSVGASNAKSLANKALGTSSPAPTVTQPRTSRYRVRPGLRFASKSPMNSYISNRYKCAKSKPKVNQKTKRFKKWSATPPNEPHFLGKVLGGALLHVPSPMTGQSFPRVSMILLFIKDLRRTE